MDITDYKSSRQRAGSSLVRSKNTLLTSPKPSPAARARLRGCGLLIRLAFLPISACFQAARHSHLDDHAGRVAQLVQQ
eukprot:scaffold81319_cov72-Phaeocystis_antarctica.AAC.2